MEEIYWITRLDSLHAILVSFSIVTILACGIGTIMCCIPEDEWEEIDIKKVYKIIKIAWIVGPIIWLATAFTPTKNEVLMMYGLGGTIDYIKENPDVKKIPDNCIRFLNEWLESEIEEKQKKSR